MKKNTLKVFIFLLISLSLFSAEINLWYGWEGEEKKSMIALVSKFEKISGNKVNLKRVPFHALNGSFRAYSLEGQGPDVVLGPSDWIGQFEPYGLLEPLNSYVSKEEESKYLESVLKSCYFQGELYGLPESYKLLALIYNKDIVKIPPKTTKELIEIGRKFTNKNEGKYGLVYRFASFYSYQPWYGGFGGKILDENNNPQFNNKEHEKALNFVKILNDRDTGIVQEDSYEDIMMSLFKSGNAAMMINGSWAIAELMKSGINFGVTRIPLINESGEWPSPFVGAEIFMLSSKSKEKDAAIDLIKFMVSAEAQSETIKLGHIPSLKEVYEYKTFKESKTYQYIQGFRTQAEVGTAMPNAHEMGVGVWGNGSGLLEKVIVEERNIQKSMNEIQEEADEAVKILRNKK